MIISNIKKYILGKLFMKLKRQIPEDVMSLVNSDVEEMDRRNKWCKSLFWYMSSTPYYRNLFYYRISAFCNKLFVYKLVSHFYPPCPTFSIHVIEGFGGAAYVLNHPYATIINARSIGSNFTCCHLTTIGNAIHGRNDLVPTIGDNVSLGANVTIIGNIKIGSNVIVGAGSVVIRDVPDNCVVAGNPARTIRVLENNHK